MFNPTKTMPSIAQNLLGWLGLSQNKKDSPDASVKGANTSAASTHTGPTGNNINRPKVYTFDEIMKEGGWQGAVHYYAKTMFGGDTERAAQFVNSTLGIGDSTQVGQVGSQQATSDPAADYYRRLENERAEEKRLSDERKTGYRTQASEAIDNLIKIYGEIINLVESVGGDSSKRIISDFEDKILEQFKLLDDAQYSVDANAAASNLADSSFRSMDRQKVADASGRNVKQLETSREDALSTLGSDIATKTAKYRAASDLLNTTTRDLLGKTEDEGELLRTLSNLGTETQTAIANKESYKPHGEFATKAANLSTFDPSNLENLFDQISGNPEADKGTKNAVIGRMIDSAVVDPKEKERLRGKYIQTGV